MEILETPLKRFVMDASISALIDEFFSIYGCPPELYELPDYVDSIGANLGAILKIIDARNVLPFSMSSQIDRYPEFWEYLLYNVELERIPRRKRPPRRYSNEE